MVISTCFPDQIFSRDLATVLFDCYHGVCIYLQRNTVLKAHMAVMEFSLSNPIFFFTALTLVLSIFSVQILKWKLSRRKKKYPPIAGTVLHHLLHFNRVHHYMTELATKYKTYRMLAPLRSEIYTSDPANVEYILKTNFDNYGKVCSHLSLIIKKMNRKVYSYIRARN